MTEQEQKAFDQMREALDTIIQYNRDHAACQYGDAEKAERWACVVKAREAIVKADAARLTDEQHLKDYARLMESHIAVLKVNAQMSEALETCTYTSSYDKSFDIVKVEEALAAADAVSAESQAQEMRNPLDLGQYVNGANISANDKPVAVIEKLQAVINERAAHHG